MLLSDKPSRHCFPDKESTSDQHQNLHQKVAGICSIGTIAVAEPSPPPRRIALAFVLVWATFTYLLVRTTVKDAIVVEIESSLLPPFVLERSWAQYSPYFSVEEYKPPPKNCRVIQANILQRHGARYPTAGASVLLEASVAKLKSVSIYTDPRMEFIHNFTYDLGSGVLIPFGAAEAFKAAGNHYERYGNLTDIDNLPFVRASGSERVVTSATNWTAGFAAASNNKVKPRLSLIIAEEGNNTLDNMCPNAGSSDSPISAWLETYAPSITARLNAWAPGANLANADIYNLMALCPFGTLAKEARSPFCDLFEEEEFQAFSYSGDLDKFYGFGYGQPLGRVQGVGYVNELIARLTSKPVVDHTQTNTTLDSSPTTFPLNRTIYADFSHDNQMIAIYSALGLFPQTRPWLDPMSPDPNRTWVAAEMVPFSAQMVTEKVGCDDGDVYIRILVSDKVQPLEFCGATDDGMCTLDAFVESQHYARNDGEGDFEKCFD